MLERQEYVREQKQAKLEKARQAKADAEAAAKPEPPKKEDKDEQFMTRLAALRHDAQAKIAQQAAEEAEAKIAAAAAEQAAAAVDPAEAARALIRTEVEFDRKVDGRYFYRLRHADDIQAKSIYRRRAGNGEGVALSVGRDAKNAEHVLQVLFDEDLWNATTAHDYLVQHYSVEYSRRLESN